MRQIVSQRFTVHSKAPVLVALALMLPVVSAHGSQDVVDASLQSPASHLQQAFTNLYEVDSTATIELVIRNRSGQERRRNFESASKIIGGRMHSIGRLTYPGHLRGMTILQVEAEDRSHDAFIYLPSSKSVRRVSTSQRGDSFFGTDVTYEDLERRNAEDYDIVDLVAGQIDGESTYVVRARPVLKQTYFEVVFWIAKSELSGTGTQDRELGAPVPYRTIEAPRASMQASGGHTLPTRLVVENVARGTITEVMYHDLAVDSEIDDRIFSIRTLEQKRPIPSSR